MRKIRRFLDEEYTRYDCIALLAENLELYESRAAAGKDCLIYIEYEDNNGAAHIFLDNEFIQSIPFSDRNELEIRLDLVKKNLLVRMRRIKGFEKVLKLSDWADIIYLFKEEELTRGGELIEFAIIASLSFMRGTTDYFDKIVVLKRRNVVLSSMFKEIMKMARLRAREYVTYEDLEEKILEETDDKISLLDLKKRFKSVN
jgi:hypothetical protein